MAHEEIKKTSSIFQHYDDDRKKEEENRAAWQLGEYVNKDCPNCGRHRLCICPNGKHRCEKCNWCPEDKVYISA